MPARGNPGAPAPRGSGKIWVCNQAYDIDWPVVNFRDNPLFNSYQESCFRGPGGGPPKGPLPFSPAKGLGFSPRRWRERRLMGGQRTNLRRLQEIIHQFVLHHDGCPTSADCFHVLHDERGLSVHFLIDNDGTIYQTLDLADGAFHATGVNEVSVGVELASRGHTNLDGEDYYRRKFGIDRPIEQITIHNSFYRAWGYTDGQYGAMFALGRALARIFPNLPQVYPQVNGGPLLTWMGDPRSFAGYLGHYHITNQKWDPGPFDFRRLTQKIASRATWFVCLGESGEAGCDRPTEIASEPAKFEAQTAALLHANEEEALGGFYPVGPFGQHRLWHGGVHLNLTQGAPVFCPFPGRIVAARNGDETTTGSRSFVLTRHRGNLGGVIIEFYMLFFHLDRESPDSPQAPGWMRGADKKPFWSQLAADEVAFPEIDLPGGELIGHAGQAGPPGNFEGQIHVEVLAKEELGQKLDPGFWKPIDASRSGHFCDVPEILGLIDRPKGRGDGILTANELREFFQKDEARAELRKLAVRFQSEWGQSGNYEAELLRSKDFAKLPKAARARLYRDQIEPMLWWTDDVAEKTGLPADAVVWHYHPVRFVAWMNQQLSKQAQTTAGKVTQKEGPAAANVLDDRESKEGFTDEDDELALSSSKLTLEDLAAGYKDEKP